MKILVLGCGMQGRAVLHDLSKSSPVKEIICADINPEVISDFTRFLDMNKIKLQKLDVMAKKALISVMKDVDIIIDKTRPRKKGGEKIVTYLISILKI